MFVLKVEKREEKGRKTNKLRKQGFLPAILYGEGVKKNILLKVEKNLFKKALSEAGTSSLITLDLAGGGKETYNVLIHSYSTDPLSGEIIHIDFFKPSAKKETIVEVPLVFEGEAPAVKDKGGVLLKEIHSIEIKGLIYNLPKEIKVDLTSLKELGDRIKVEDLGIPENVSVMRDKEDIIALVEEHKEEEIPAVEPEAEEEEKEEKESGEKEQADEQQEKPSQKEQSKN